jgi:hypothetical protein
MVDLLRIDPADVQGFWPQVEPLLKSAIDRTGLSEWRAIADDILYGHGVLWICRDGERILCAGATSLQKTDSGLVCVITACGGSDMRRWLPLLAKIEAYAMAEGCRCVRIFGRRGWSRVLAGYVVPSVVLEKELT